MNIDLHTHSTASDGTDTPDELARLAAQAGLSAIALTDHDTTDGHAACASACAEVGVEVVPGIEMSTDRGRPRGTLHVLGYFVDGEAPALRAITRRLREARNERNPEMVTRLNELGIRVSMERVVELSGGSVVGRPHIAAAMVELGVVRSVSEAFAKYIGRGGAAYVRRDNLSPGLAIEAIHAAGGVAAVAHPIQLACRDEDDLRGTMRDLVALGVDGVEAWHADHSADYRRGVERLAADFGLIVTGGSDYHGDRKDIALGSQCVPAEVLDALD
ncbi:MAG: PHP domain-containing protein [Planctomycetota bacterium]|jgi:predicted metal-dependent phosphoesterase TrpH